MSFVPEPPLTEDVALAIQKKDSKHGSRRAISFDKELKYT